MSLGELLEFGSVEDLQRAMFALEKQLSRSSYFQEDQEMIQALQNELSLRAA
jgi:hypothetical protein